MTPSLLLVLTCAAMFKMAFSVWAIEYHLVAIHSLGWERWGETLHLYRHVPSFGENRTRGKFHKYQRKIHTRAGGKKIDKFASITYVT